MPIALCRITLKMALDFQMTWVKKDNSLTVLRGNTWRFFNSVLGIVLVLCYWNRFNMYGLFSPLTGKAAPGICRYLGSWPSTLFVAKHMQTPGSLLIQLGWDPIFRVSFMLALEKEAAAHSSVLAWRIPWTEEAGRLQSVGSQRVGHGWVSGHRCWHDDGSVSRCASPGEFGVSSSACLWAWEVAGPSGGASHVSTFMPKYVLNETAFRECFREQWGITLWDGKA